VQLKQVLTSDSYQLSIQVDNMHTTTRC